MEVEPVEERDEQAQLKQDYYKTEAMQGRAEKVREAGADTFSKKGTFGGNPENSQSASSERAWQIGCFGCMMPHSILSTYKVLRSSSGGFGKGNSHLCYIHGLKRALLFTDGKMAWAQTPFDVYVCTTRAWIYG